MKRLVALMPLLLLLTACSSKKETKPDDNSALVAFDAQLKAKAIEDEARAKAKAIETEAKLKAQVAEAKALEAKAMEARAIESRIAEAKAAETKALIAAKEMEARRLEEERRREGAKRQDDQAEEKPTKATPPKPKRNLAAKVVPPPTFPAFDPKKLRFDEYQTLVASIKMDHLRAVDGVRRAAAQDARRRMIKDGVPSEIRDYMIDYAMGTRSRQLTERSKLLMPKFDGWEDWDEILILSDAQKNYQAVGGR